MKKLIIVICGSILFTGVFAQEEIDMTSKRGVPILPEKGEIGLGINANPLLNYVGNFFNGNLNNNSASFNFINGFQAVNTIYIKYYLEENVAIRGGLRMGHINDIDREFIIKDQDVPDPLDEVTDIHRYTATTINIGGDYLMYRGTGRLKGYYGGGVLFMHWTERDTYEYGNPLNAENPNPSTTNFGNNVSAGASERLLESFSRNRLGVGARAIIGIEYFFAPKISVGGELGIGLWYNNNSGYNTIERYTGTEYEKITANTAKDTRWGMDNFTTGSIFLMFHF